VTRLGVVTTDTGGPVVRHRVLALRPALSAAGIEVELLALPKRLHARLGFFRALRDFDAVLLVRKLFMGAELRALRSSCARLVFDLDDAVMFRDPARNRPVSYVRRRRFRRTVRSADLVTAGNDYLLGLVREDAPKTTSILAPTLVDTDRYTPGPPGAGFRVGWIGSRSTRAYLRLAAPALAAVARERSDLTVAVMADAPPDELEGLPLEFTSWTEAGEAAFLRSLHVGIMPLSDDPFSRGKCGLKLLQYMASGVPSVASPVGVNVEMLGGGRAGIAAADTEGWTRALLGFAADDSQRRAVGEAARAVAEEYWSVRTLGPVFAQALVGCVSGAMT
jgi:glycosyltransferase involved in cell wall biosynthesis